MLYRIAVYLAEPYTLALLMLWLATLRMVFRSEAVRGKGLVVAALLLLTAVSTPAAGHLAIASLEDRYPFNDELPPGTQAIVVLGGATRLMDPAGEHAVLAGDSMMRCLHAAAIYRAHGRRPIVLSGGKVDADEPGPTVAGAMRDFLLTQGVAADDLKLEEASTSTYENAAACRDLLDKEGWTRVLLVTDALHMERARRCFAAVGVEATPSPCNHAAAYFEWSAGSFAPSLGGLIAVTTAAHEWLGLAWYRLTGRI